MGRCQRQWRRRAVSGEVGAGGDSAFAEEQVYQLPDEKSCHFWNGPLPGDLAELEAFCRIFRLSEQLHNVVMNALNSLSYAKSNRAVLDDSYGIALSEPVLSDAENRLLLEQKVVAGLGCIGALLHQHKQKVLGGSLRSRRASENLHDMVEDDSTPPLGRFRAEMKKCCQQLELAVVHCFPPVDKQSSAIHKRLQRLRNVCFDAGYPRPEGSPSHAVVPNWVAVRFWCGRVMENPGMDGEVEFYQGGQLTGEGLKWLLEKGFRTIVDLRAGNEMDQLAEDAIGSAVSQSQLRLVRLPVELGFAPTKEQVEIFAELVGDPQNHLLYLQSQEGVGRTSAMVSRWRELNLHKKSQGLVDSSFKMIGFSSQAGNAGENARIGGDNGDATPAVEELFDEALNEDWQDGFNLATADSICGSENDISCEDTSDANCHNILDSRIETSVYARQDYFSNVAALESKKETAEESLVQCSPTEGISGTVSPLEAQMPSQNVFSRQAMSNFRKGRKVVPAQFVCKRREIDTHALLSPPSEDQRIIQYRSIAGPAGQWDLSGLGIPRAGISTEALELDTEIQNQEQDGFKVNKPTSDSIPEIVEKVGNLDSSGNELFGKQRDPASLSLSQKKSLGVDRLFKGIGDEGSDDDSDESGIVGDMCASTTGVVRLQSRKKAEMYLVRTDGFSCTREKVKESTLAFTHPSTQQQMLMWKTAPKTVLLLKKLGDELMDEAQQVALFLHNQEGMNVVVEPEVHDCFARVPGFGFVQTFYIQDTSHLHERVDFVACLGGDGVILHVSNLFRSAVPPVVSFNLGSLGFLTTHPFEDFKQDLQAIIHGNSRVEGVYITLRMRLQCELFRDGKSTPNKVIDVLNEVVLDRGSNPYLCKIECYEHNRLITKVQADGVIVATPTGSTAYSTAAGGSMVHPNVPCILFTPICPHSLSFRPVILPDSALLELKVPHDARSNAWVSFDGKRRQQLSKGDSVRICMSKHPLPTVNKSDQTDDWFRSLVRCLNWNERLEQKSLPACF